MVRAHTREFALEDIRHPARFTACMDANRWIQRLYLLSFANLTWLVVN